MTDDPFLHAPPSVAVGGLNAVPIDIQLVTATLTFDCATRTAAAHATVAFSLGPAGGHPMFDLRQTITTASLDGLSLAAADLAPRDLGGGSGTEMRVIARSLAAASMHTLTLDYALGVPAAAGARPIGFDPASARVAFDLWMSDLFPGRYLEMWLPANLIYDRFAIDLEVRVEGTAVDHLPFANGDVTTLAPNRWRIAYPSRSCACSPMLVVLPVDRIARHSSSVSVVGSPQPVAIDLMKATSNPIDLATLAGTVAGYLTANGAAIGPYTHGDRFSVYLWDEPTRSMEYAGATTSNEPSLQHEMYHSWWGRGVTPATAADGWIDEAWTVYMTGGIVPVQPYGPADPPETLHSPNAFARVTPQPAYDRGSRFFAGVAAVVGAPALHALMAEFYKAHRGHQITTADLEAHLVARSGQIEVAELFHRYVYGRSVPPVSARPDLAIRDALDDTGAEPYGGGRFWDSPDVWVRNADDGGTLHEAPEHGQDNVVHVRVRNRGVAAAATFVVTVNARPWAGTEFLWPVDWLPAFGAAVGFDLAPGAERVMKIVWPAAAVPAAGTHTCLLAAVTTPGDLPVALDHVWDRNDLGQKNVTVVDLAADDTVVVPFELASLQRHRPAIGTIELWRPPRWPALAAAIRGSREGAVETLWRSATTLPIAEPAPATAAPELRIVDPAWADVSVRGRSHHVAVRLGGGSVVELAAPASPPPSMRAAAAEAELRPGEHQAIVFGAGLTARLPFRLAPRAPLPLQIALTAPHDAAPGDEIPVDIVQRAADGTIAGGITIVLRIV